MPLPTPTKTVMLIHGAWLTPLSWEAVRARYEARGFKVIAPAWRIGGIEAKLRVRAGEEGPRRAADGASKAARRAGTREGATPWGPPCPGRPGLRREAGSWGVVTAAAPGSAPRLLGWSQVLQYRAHPSGGRHIRQHLSPASAPRTGEHV